MALLPYLVKHFDRVFYIGGSGVEKGIAEKYGLPYFCVTAVKFRRAFTLKNLAVPFRLLRGIGEAKAVLKKIAPDIVFSKGGFVALPVVIAALRLNIPVAAHESDLSMGLSNRLTAKKCSVVCSTFPPSKFPNAVHTGAIIRQELYTGSKIEIMNKYFPAANTRPNLLVMGGSSGSAAINAAVWDALDKLLNRFNVLHFTGEGKGRPDIKKYGYAQCEYTASPQNAFAWADVVVSRAGSGAVCELIALRKPAVLIPLPRKESRGDQIDNAKYAKELGVCEVILQEDLTRDSLTETAAKVFGKRRQISTNCGKAEWADGTEKVVKQLLDLLANPRRSAANLPAKFGL
jgi:UDP-N-acetylglucosamine--N-acetylmuramyl-(pentapeptide) pyrophosphoryl-undecaprenol N-acetylglucosamine transferase